MVNYPTILNLPQEDINRQLYEMIVKLQNENAGEGTDITALKTTVGNSTSGLVKDVADIKAAIGSESDATSILGMIKALKTTVGDSTSGLVKDVADIKDEIGSESDATSILGRIKALEPGQD